MTQGKLQNNPKVRSKRFSASKEHDSIFKYSQLHSQTADPTPHRGSSRHIHIQLHTTKEKPNNPNVRSKDFHPPAFAAIELHAFTLAKSTHRLPIQPRTEKAGATFTFSYTRRRENENQPIVRFKRLPIDFQRQARALTALFPERALM